MSIQKIKQESLDFGLTGAVAFFGLNTAPAGWLKANGALVSRTTYASLFAVIGTTYGAGDGSTTFALPDMRGEFPRGWDDGRAVDSGRSIGTAQLDAFQGHWHSYVTSGFEFSMGNFIQGAGGSQRGGAPAGYNDVTNPVTDRHPAEGSPGPSGIPRTAPETRPRNVALLACIKF
jgi:phage-related tail fiber protein